jgi:hypothetical protein
MPPMLGIQALRLGCEAHMGCLSSKEEGGAVGRAAQASGNVEKAEPKPFFGVEGEYKVRERPPTAGMAWRRRAGHAWAHHTAW